MEISLFLFPGKQFTLYGHSVYIIIRDCIFPFVFKGSFVRKNILIHQILTALYHYDEVITVFVHKPDIRLTEVSPVEDESCISVSIRSRLFKHILQL